MKKKLCFLYCLTCLVFLTISCNQKQAVSDPLHISKETRIVSLNGTITEILFSLGLGDKIAGVDITSNFPESVAKIPKIGHSHDLSAEGILGLKPTLVIGPDDNVKPELREQLRSAGIPLLLFHADHTVAGAKKLITDIADTLGFADKALPLCKGIDQDTSGMIRPAIKPRVLFIYARGIGAMMVAGTNNSVNSMIELAGGENAVKDFSSYKPLTAESLVTANPDLILMFDKGLESLGGINGLLKVQGISQTQAGKNKKVVEMDGQFLTGFGPRTGKAIAELSKKLNEAEKP